jgi:CO/xanthine dehydrogenase FAD-binding subunit
MTNDTLKDGTAILDEGCDEATVQLCIGAEALLQSVRDAPTCPPILYAALGDPLTWQQRNSTTVKDVVFSPNLAARWVAALLALGASLIFTEKEGLLADFLYHMLPAGETLSTVAIPINVPGRVWGESRVASPPASPPIVSAVAVVDLKDDSVHRARVALTGVGRHPAQLAHAADRLTGHKLGQESIHEVATAVMEEINPPDDYRGSAEYRRELAGLLTRRSLEQCLKGASEL